MTVVYKKTDRVRKTASHAVLEDAVTGIVPVLERLTGSPVDVTLARSTEQKYARALFDINFGDGVTITGKTAEQIVELLAGIRTANELCLLASRESISEAA